MFWEVFWAVLAALFVYDISRKVWTALDLYKGIGAWSKLQLIGAFFACAAIGALVIGAIVSLFSPRFQAWLVPVLNKLTFK